MVDHPDYTPNKKRVEDAFGEETKWVEIAPHGDDPNICIPVDNKGKRVVPAVHVNSETAKCTAGGLSGTCHHKNSTASNSPEQAVHDAKTQYQWE